MYIFTWFFSKPSRTARRSVPTWEVFGLHFRVLRQTQPHLSTSEVGRFLRKRRVCGHGSPQTRTNAKTDQRRHGSPLSRTCLQRRTARRSVPTSEVFGLHLRVLRQTQPHLSTSEVGRFLRKRRVCGHETPQIWTNVKTDHRRHGTPLSRTARRSVPTSEADRT